MTSERALQQIRHKIFEYPEDRAYQAMRVLAYLKMRMLRERRTQPVSIGPYSGLARHELRRTGTCETDWF